MKRVAVVGLGYVGLPLALLAKEKGYDVVGIDLDKEKVKLINEKKSPIEDAFIDENLPKHPFKAYTDFSPISESEIVIICVPTPVKNLTPNLAPLKGATEEVAKKLSKDTLVIVESTVNPGVCDDVVKPIIEKFSGLNVEENCFLAHCPERINPGDEKWTVKNINRVVGSNSEVGLKKAKEFYDNIVEADIKPMGSLKEAEAVKVIENSFRDVNIAFVNELAMSFHRMGINLENVIDGAATKPFAFMPHRPGCGVGGHCIPVDPYYLIEYARGFGFNHDFLSLARRINSQMPEFTVELLKDALNSVGKSLKNTKVAMLGLAYKPNVDDDRESPAYEIKDLISKNLAEVVSYDPYIQHNSDVDSLQAALEGADALVITTAHKEFTSLKPSSLKNAGIKVVVDGRNLFKLKKQDFVDAGIKYVGIGV